MMAWIRDILVISSPRDLPRFEELFRGSEKWGIHRSSIEQDRRRGIEARPPLGFEFCDQHHTFDR
jgi:glucose-1-phosphate thymidylyltransferase